LYGGHKLFLSEDGFEVVRVDCGVASIPPFRIDVPLSSESVQFGAKMIRVSKTQEVDLNFSYFFSYFYFIFDLFSFILFLELGLGLE